MILRDGVLMIEWVEIYPKFTVSTAFQIIGIHYQNNCKSQDKQNIL